jgi:hypothetical protein
MASPLKRLRKASLVSSGIVRRSPNGESLNELQLLEQIAATHGDSHFGGPHLLSDLVRGATTNVQGLFCQSQALNLRVPRNINDLSAQRQFIPASNSHSSALQELPQGSRMERFSSRPSTFLLPLCALKKRHLGQCPMGTTQFFLCCAGLACQWVPLLSAASSIWSRGQ